MHVLVTGGAGFIGSHLTDALIAAGHTVCVLDNFASGQRANLPPGAEVIERDIRDLEALRPVFKGVDYVFHTAAMARVMLSIERPVETHMVNVIGTLNVLIAARDAGVRRVIYSGSSSVYGDQAELPLRETMTPNPLNPYALQKLAAEQYTRMFHRLFGLETLTLRYFNVYGDRMTTEGAYVTVIGLFIRERVAGRPLMIHGDGSQTRDFTHVSDVVHANLAAMKSAIADGRALNVGRGSALSVSEVAALVGGEKVFASRRPGDPQATLADLTETHKVLGWLPQVDTATAIRELVRAAAIPAAAVKA